MATHSVGYDERGAHAKTLTPGEADTVAFARHCNFVDVMSHNGAAAVYFTVDGTSPAVGANAAFMLPEHPGSVRVRIREDGPTAVKLISVGAVVYSVERA